MEKKIISTNFNRKKQEISDFIRNSMNFKENYTAKNLHFFIKTLQKKITTKNKIHKKIAKNLKISLEFNKIINEEYKYALLNDKRHFLALYNQNPQLKTENFFKEGETDPPEVPSFIIDQMFHFCVGFLFLLKFLNSTLN